MKREKNNILIKTFLKQSYIVYKGPFTRREASYDQSTDASLLHSHAL